MGVDVSLTIDGVKVTVPKGTLLVDAAKKAGIDIPVFCYHPKMEPVGMCRMCLAEIGRPIIDRQSGEAQREPDGSVKLWFGPKLETACTTPVADGMVVNTSNQKVKDASKATLEFLLTSHPLDCPVCDKGGECPLQNLSMAHASTQSRFIFDEKHRSDKHYPLGELIFLDRERCIQCGRCVRFQADIAGDPVLAFYQRCRDTDIITNSIPGFDSYFSGNTTDICPVGALTTADFRFKARPWEMKPVASLCNHCPVGCNTALDTRREALTGGDVVIKRIRPRQNEAVNETWICDKGRFVHHYASSPQRLTTPLVRKNGHLEPCTWEEALELAARKIKEVGTRLVTLVGGRLANEDLYNLASLTRRQNGKALLYSYMSGGDLVARFGLEDRSDLGKLANGDVILVVASDLHEEAPIWWLRVKQAVKRGAKLIVLHPRQTRLDQHALHSIRYAYGEESKVLAAFLPENAPHADKEWKSAIDLFAKAENTIVFYGSEGIGLEASHNLARACAELLLKTQHIGRPNNGLVAVWHTGNIQGAWDMGFRPDPELVSTIKKAGVAYLVAADPAGDKPSYELAIETADFVIVQDLFLTETAKLAHLVLPTLPFTEREGTYTSGERRLQRFYPAVPARTGARADFSIAAQISMSLGYAQEADAAALVLQAIRENIPGYTDMNYARLAEVQVEWPLVGDKDAYFGGTSQRNLQGAGAHLHTVGLVKSTELPDALPVKELTIPLGAVRLVPVNSLYDRSRLVKYTGILEQRLARVEIRLHPELARSQGLQAGLPAKLILDGFETNVDLILDDKMPVDYAIVPRSVGVPISGPMAATVRHSVPESQT